MYAHGGKGLKRGLRKIFNLKECPRCKLSFEISLTNCPHCHDRTDEELEVYFHKNDLPYEKTGNFVPFLILGIIAFLCLFLAMTLHFEFVAN